jgi:FAD/FMN-containing dehydrogenase
LPPPDGPIDVSATHIDRLTAIVGTANCLTDASEMSAFTTDYRKLYVGRAMAVVRPRDTRQVSEVMGYCYEHRIAVVPQGGNTSLLGGAVPMGGDTQGPCIALSLVRLNKVVSIDPVIDTMIVQAGVTLAAAREAADEAQRLFPLRIGSEGSCQIGGNLATNAGGTAVLRYGNMRDLVLGLEVVLPDGEIWHGLRALRKDNTGYDLKQLFIGSEGTLGIITAAVLKLFPKPRSTSTALLATRSPETALELLGFLKSRLGNDVTAFELISAPALALVLEHLRDEEPLFQQLHDWMILVEAISHAGQAEADDEFHAALIDAFDAGLVLDALLGTTEAHARRFSHLREKISDAQTRDGGSVRCDISVPLAAIPEFIDEATARVLALEPATRMVVYGHMDDGNVHFNPLRPAGTSAQAFVSTMGARITEIVDGIAMSVDGSISAEHGVGVAKRDELLNVKSEVELQTCWRIKRALDPKNLLNPGKVLPDLESVLESQS